ncbi:MAG: hypothetical protein V9F00_09675 [Nocardioides sp.]
MPQNEPILIIDLEDEDGNAKGTMVQNTPAYICKKMNKNTRFEIRNTCYLYHCNTYFYGLENTDS